MDLVKLEGLLEAIRGMIHDKTLSASSGTSKELNPSAINNRVQPEVKVVLLYPLNSCE